MIFVQYYKTGIYIYVFVYAPAIVKKGKKDCNRNSEISSVFLKGQKQFCEGVWCS